MDTTALKRLSTKTDQQTLIMELQQDYRLSPVESKVLFGRLQEYLSEHQHDYLADGQIIYPEKDGYFVNRRWHFPSLPVVL